MSNNENNAEARILRQYVLVGAPVMLFLVSLIYLGSSLDPFAPVKTAVFRAYALGGALVWAYECLAGGRLMWRRTPADIPFAASLVWLGFSALNAINRPMAAERWLDIFCGALVFYMIALVCRGASDARTLLGRSSVTLLFMAALGALDLMRISVFPWDTLLISNKIYSVFELMGVQGSPPAQWAHSFEGRVSASFGNPVYMAGAPLLLLAPLWAMYTGAQGAARRRFFIFLFLIAEFLLLATFSRAAWASAVAGGAALWLLSRAAAPADRAALFGARAGVALALAVLLAAGAGFSVRNRLRPAEFSIQQRVATMADAKDESLWQRALIWKTAWEAVKDHPIKGVGLDNYVVWHPRYQIKFFEDEKWAPHASYPDRAHNEYLDAMAETGAAGLALMAAAMCALFFIGLEAAREGGDSGRLAAGLTAGGAALALYALMQFPFHVPAVAAFAWAAAGLLPGLREGGSAGIVGVRIWRPARGRERALAALVLAALFASAVPALARPTIANIKFSWAVRHAEKAPPEKVMEMMRASVVAEPGNMEMTVRFGMTANAMAARETDEDKKKRLYAAVRDESLRGLAYFPYESRLMENLGVSLIRLGEPEQALGPLKNAVVINPEYALSFYNLGIAYYLLNNYNASIYSYGRAIELDPDMPGAKRNLGLANARVGKHDIAEEMFARALEEDPDNKAVMNSLGLAQARQGKAIEAISSYRRALSVDPGYIEARGNLAIELIAVEDFSGAERELLKVLESDPESEVARHHLKRAREMAAAKKLSVRSSETAK